VVENIWLLRVVHPVYALNVAMRLQSIRRVVHVALSMAINTTAISVHMNSRNMGGERMVIPVTEIWIWEELEEERLRSGFLARVFIKMFYDRRKKLVELCYDPKTIWEIAFTDKIYGMTGL